jgi:hypothetical protein
MTTSLPRCTHCNGHQFMERDIDGWYLQCRDCGRMTYLNLKRQKFTKVKGCRQTGARNQGNGKVVLSHQVGKFKATNARGIRD